MFLNEKRFIQKNVKDKKFENNFVGQIFADPIFCKGILIDFYGCPYNP